MESSISLTDEAGLSMKVGDGQKAQRAESADPKGAKPDNRRGGEENRSFSQFMERRKGPHGERISGDERGRELREGKIQQSDRERDSQQLNRRDFQRSEQRRSTPNMENRPSEAQLRRDSSTKDEKSDIGREGRESRRDGGEALAPEALELREIGDVRGQTEAAGATEEAGACCGSEEINEVARQIVDAIRVGEDGQARRVVFLDVTVPGKGDIRIRLRRDGSGMEVRMRAGNDALARTLQEGIGQLREEGAKKDIQFTSVQVVR